MRSYCDVRLYIIPNDKLMQAGLPGTLAELPCEREEYRRARAEADAIAAKANKQKLIDNAADELKSKNKNRYGE